jgi:hypothetical protein
MNDQINWASEHEKKDDPHHHLYHTRHRIHYPSSSSLSTGEESEVCFEKAVIERF